MSKKSVKIDEVEYVVTEEDKNAPLCAGCVGECDSDLCTKICREFNCNGVILKKPDTDKTSQGKKYDSDKNRYDLIPANALNETVKVLTHGATKYNEAYDEENWRKVDHAKRRYFGALQRHIWAVKRGETHDPETGIHHYAHALSNLMFLLEMELDPDYQSK